MNSSARLPQSTARRARVVACALACAMAASFVVAQAPSTNANIARLPIFDAHLHYNDEAWQAFPPEKVFEIFRTHGVVGILANSRPNLGTWTLLKHPLASRIAIVPFVRVYRDRSDYGSWFEKQAVYDHIVSELDREKRAIGIGEFHLSGDQGKHAGVARIVALAKSRDLWLHAHADEASLRAILALDPQAKVIWAHTGFGVPTETVRSLLRAHPNLYGELSYRSDVSESAQANSAWRALMVEHGDRFLLGSDTWVPQRWESYGDTMAAYRGWLAALPPEVARKVAYENAERMFKLKPRLDALLSTAPRSANPH